MTDETQRIFNLMQNSMKAISDSGVWRYFLKTAAWHFKYSFNDQVLIFAQKSEATACAGMDDWVNKTKRWVKKDASPIALVRENGNQYHLDYVFDISDTSSFGKREIKLWQYDKRYEEAVIQTLEWSFGKLKVTTSDIDAIICLANKEVNDRKGDYLRELKYVKGDSFLSGLDNVNLDLRFRQTAAASVAYMIMQRMGLQPDSTFDEYDFQYIRDFNTVETMNILGNAVSTIAEGALRDIAKTIHLKKNLQKKKTAYIIKITKKKIMFKQKGLMKMTNAVAYTKVGDYRIPNLTVPAEEYQIGKYGMMRRTYLKEHRPTLYSLLMMKGELLKHLEEIDRTTTQQVQKIVEQMAKAEGLTEEMKSTDPLLWTGLMNNFLHSAEEIVLSETVYS